ncbi:MAG: protein kinase, partial [Holophagales bacterium]|nr:protein kinase [Holophagales bacterium]
MDELRWHRIDSLFGAALELSDSGRRALLDEECADDPELRRAVERLLALEAEADEFLAYPAVGREPTVDSGESDESPTSADELAGIRIGPYRLMGPLGRGGMGVVYLAHREDHYRQEVAIKLARRSRLGRRGQRRLATERQALARLEHPNIARLYDGGTTDDGIPYLVMERVVGRPIDRYCDERRLTIRARLELMLQVLDAVALAHHHLRVHCDIKPSNILVTESG